MASNRGRYAHGRDKDERVLRWYDYGYQAWWFLALLIVAMAVAAAGAGFGIASQTHRTNSQDVRRAYQRGYATGLSVGERGSSPSTSTTTTTVHVHEPDSVASGSGAPAPDAPIAPAPPVPVPAIHHTG